MEEQFRAISQLYGVANGDELLLSAKVENVQQEKLVLK